MTPERLKELCLKEESIAHIHGWDFSHINGRYEEESTLPWDYKEEILKLLSPEMQILDIDTGGGEFLLSLGHPYENTAAAEGYSPNIALCKETLLPLGIDFRPTDESGLLPFEDNRFDLVLNRHGDLPFSEIFRILKPGGVFLTQQVGANNDRELVELLLPESPVPFPRQWLELAAEDCKNIGFTVLDGQEAFCPIRFYDLPALTWFARIISWEFIDFSVERCFDRLLKAQTQLEKDGVLEGTAHRFFLKAQKPR